MMTTVNIGLIDYNPYRFVEDYPIDKEQVKRLKDSMEELDPFGGLPARKVGTRYQIAAGHHRLEAMKQLEHTEVLLDIHKYTDSQMINVMAVENAAQRGHSAAAAMNSIHAKVGELTYLILSEKNAQEFLSDFNDAQKGQILGNIKSGQGVGESLVLKSFPENVISLHVVRETLAAMKADGTMKQVINSVHTRLEEEAIAAEKAAKAASDRNKKKAEADAEIAKQAKETAKEASRNTTVGFLAKGIANSFDNSNQLDAFRSSMAESTMQKMFPKAIQKKLVKDMLAELEEGSGKASGAKIRRWLQDKVKEGNLVQSKVTKAEREAAKLSSAQDILKDHMSQLNSALTTAGINSADIHKLLKEYPSLITAGKLPKVIEGIDRAITALDKLKLFLIKHHSK